ncbi:MAG TPA: hypothetical protein VGE09_15150 [Pseudoxanthomonas sp.]
MKGRMLECLLLVLMVAGPGCRASSRASDSIPITTRENSSTTPRLPDVLTGVWYSDDAEGASRCRRYRALLGAEKGHDEAVAVLVGSLVVTPDLIHVFAEYGEGDFLVVERSEPDGGDAWRVTTRLGIDALPDGQSVADREMSRLSLHEGKLEWEFPARFGGAPATYFRCDSVRQDIYPAEVEEKATEVMS